MTKKQCTKCKVLQPLEQFARHNSTKDGLHTQCKNCTREYLKIWRARNKERLSESKREYREENKEYIAAYLKQWRSENKERKAELDRQWRINNRDKRRVANAKRRAQARLSSGDVNADVVYQMVEDQQGLCAYCEVPLFGEFHIDHMLPLIHGGRHEWQNIAISCPGCNLSKGSKTAEEYFSCNKC